jgi:hypothetical protein
MQQFDQADYYWQVGSLKTFSKQQAIMWANGDVSKIHYFFMDDVWAAQDWTKRPDKSLNDLMRTRCFQLRNQYRHVRVAYSGGYDSQGIVDAFVAAGLPIDSVMIRIKQYKPTPENLIAVQQATALKNSIWPGLDIETIQLHASDFYDFYKQHANDWIVQPAGGYEPWFYKVNLSFLQNHNQDFQKARDKFVGQSQCDVYGVEKPRLWIENGAWYATMIDKTMNWVANTDIESFYISRQLPELHVAQTWAMLDWIESQPFTEHQQVHDFLHAIQSHKLGWDAYRDWNLAIGRGMVQNPHSYQGGGTKGYNSGNPRNNLGCQDLMAEAAKTNPDALRIWQGQLDDFETQYQSAIDSQGEITGCWSNKYYIKPVEPGRLARIT